MSLQLTIVPGKEVIRQLVRWADDEFGASFGAIALAREIRSDEIDEEVVTVLETMSSGWAFDVHTIWDLLKAMSGLRIAQPALLSSQVPWKSRR